MINAELSIRSELISLIRDTLSCLFIDDTYLASPIPEIIHDPCEPYLAQQPIQDMITESTPQFYDFDI